MTNKNKSTIPWHWRLVAFALLLCIGSYGGFLVYRGAGKEGSAFEALGTVGYIVLAASIVIAIVSILIAKARSRKKDSQN